MTADGESTSDIDGQPTDHLGKRLVIALILTIPTFVITLLALAKIAMPGWLTNPWLHAIVITPVMFYCAAPIHHRGLPALQRRHPKRSVKATDKMTYIRKAGLQGNLCNRQRGTL